MMATTNKTAKDLFDIATEAGDGAAIVANFKDAGVVALVHKAYGEEMRIDGVNLHAPFDSRISAARTRELIEKFESAGSIGNIRVNTKDELPLWPEVRDKLMVYSEDELLTFMANATNRVKQKRASDLEKSAVNMKEYVNQLMKDIAESNAMLVKTTTQEEYKFPKDFAHDVLEMQGLYWDIVAMEIKVITLREALMTGDMYCRRAMFFVGPAGRGKSKMVEAIGARLARRHKWKYWLNGKSIDPLGIVTRTNKIKHAGALVLNDFKLQTLQDKYLDEEGVKNLLSPEEMGDIPARYHVAKIPIKCARVFAVNSEVHPEGHPNEGEVWWTEWFDTQPGCEPLSAVINGDVEYLKKMGGKHEAIARRAVFFLCEGWCRPKPKEGDELKDKTHEYFLEGLQHEEEMGI